MIEFSSGPIPTGWTAAERAAVEKAIARRRRLRDLDLDRVDLVAAGANQGALVALVKSAGAIPISKIDEERYRVFGFASVASVKGQMLVDSHGDEIPPAELEEAAARFRGSAGLNHQGDPIGEIFESVYVDATKARAMGMSIADETFAAWWIGMQLAPGPVWDQVKAGKLPAFSVQGKAMAEPIGKSASRQRSVAPPPPVPNPEREAFLRERAAAIRKGEEAFRPETAPERQRREIVKAKKRAEELLKQLKEQTR